jgi:hypothetical protein
MGIIENADPTIHFRRVFELATKGTLARTEFHLIRPKRFSKAGRGENVSEVGIRGKN